VTGGRPGCFRLASLHGRGSSRELFSHRCHCHGDPKHFGDCRLPAFFLGFLFGLPLGLDCLRYPPRLGLLCDSPRFGLPGSSPGFSLGKLSSLGLFRLTTSFGFCLGLAASRGFGFREAPGLRRGDAPLFFFSGSSSRLLNSFSSGFLFRGFMPSLFFCLTLRFFSGLTLRFFGS